jgi:non-ribosomal peptide synthetase component F
MVKAILALWKIGAAYLPLDLRDPQDRINDIISEANARFVIIQSSTGVLSVTKPVIEIDRIEHAIATDPKSSRICSFDPLRTAYVIFTSGSTGRPKGAMIEHLGMMNHLWAKVNDLKMNRESTVAQNATHCFDISVWQFFSGLICGGTTVIYDHNHVLLPERLLQAVSDDSVTILEVVPSYLVAMMPVLENSPSILSSLKYLLVTGESISWTNRSFR